MERELDPDRPNRLTPEQISTMTPEEILAAHNNKLIELTDLTSEQISAIAEITHGRNCEALARLDDLEDQGVAKMLARIKEDLGN